MMTSLIELIVIALMGVGEPTPDGWHTYSARDEIAPAFRVERSKSETAPHSYMLGLAGRGDEAVDGRWVREVPRVRARITRSPPSTGPRAWRPLRGACSPG